MLALCLLLAVLTLVCLRIAWRLRRADRVGTDRHCAVCEFNLTGRPSESMRCPECGADLASPSAIQVGLGRPDWVGVSLALLFAVALAAGTYAAGRSADWDAARVRAWPSAWLTEEVERGLVPIATAEELVRRIQSGSLTGEARLRALKALLEVKPQVRATARAGDKLPFAEMSFAVLSIPGNYAWSFDRERPAFRMYRRLARYRVGEGAWREKYWAWNTVDPFPFGYQTIYLDVPGDQPVGATTVDIAYEFRLVPAEAAQLFVAAHPNGLLNPNLADPSIDGWTQTVRAPIRIAAAGAEDDVALIVDPTLRDAVRASIVFEELARLGWERMNGAATARGLRMYRGKDGTLTGGVRIDLNVDRPPVALAFDAFVRHPTTGVEHRIGAFVAPKAMRYGLQAGVTPTPADGAALFDWPEPRATVILRPSKAKARENPNVTAIWGEPIVFEDVPIVREWVEADRVAATRPATSPGTR